MAVKAIAYRVYSHYLACSRLDAYEELLQTFIERGFKTQSIASFWGQFSSDSNPIDGLQLVLRHDVDVDPFTAQTMWEIEQRFGVRSSFYFRLSTVDLPLMRKIQDSGSEASYHYEELATLAKRLGLVDKQDIANRMRDIQDEFRENYKSLKASSGLPMVSVASHGDFANRALATPNWVLLQSDALRSELGIQVEAYDERLMSRVSCRYSDALYPLLWSPEHPYASFASAAPLVVYILIHPGNWRPNIKRRLKEDIKRLREGFLYKMRY